LALGAQFRIADVGSTAISSKLPSMVIKASAKQEPYYYMTDMTAIGDRHLDLGVFAIV
jgi:hypothetical protein